MSTEDLGDRLAREAIPVAGELVMAVWDHDGAAVESALRDLDAVQLRALAVVLAAHVRLDRPLTLDPRPAPSHRDEERVCNHALAAVCARLDLHPDDVLNKSRERTIVEARQVAMSVALASGAASSAAVGRYFGRDHSTVLYAARRVAELPHLAHFAREVIEQLAA